MNFLKRFILLRSPFHTRFPSPTAYVAEQIDRRVAVDRQRGFIYFRIPKAANSTVTVTLQAAGADVPTSMQAKQSFARASDLGRDEVDHLGERFFLFSVVRDPFARLASAYLHKVMRSPRYQSLVNQHLRRPAQTPIDFLQFCQFIAQGGLHLNPHWFPQRDLIPIGFDALHFIGRVESLESDLRQIMARIGGAREDRLHSWDPHRTNASERLASLYCGESLDIVRRCYRDDFLGLGYEQYPQWAQGLNTSA